METNCINNKVLGYLKGSKLVRFNVSVTARDVARSILADVVRSEGFKFNDKGRSDWMNDTKDYYINELGDVVDSAYIIESLFNSVHIIGLNRKQVSSRVEKECI